MSDDREHPFVRNDELLRGVLDTMFAFVCVLSPDCLVVEVNRSPLEAAGLGREAVVGVPFADTYWFSHSRQARAHVIDTLERVVTKGEAVRADFEVRIGPNQVIIVDASFAPLRGPAGELAGIVGSAVDVTERRRTEVALRESEQRFRHLTETIREVFFLVDLETGRTLYVSPAYEEMWGRSCQSAYDNPTDWADAIHPDDRERMHERMREHPTLGSFEDEYRIVRPDGTVRWIRTHGSPVRDASGRAIRIAGVSEDTTQKRELETQLRHAQKMDGLGRLAGGVAHDFNNLLMVIAANADLVLTSPSSSEETIELVDDIRIASERAKALTRQLLLFSRREVFDLRVIELDEAIGDGVKMLRRLLGEDVILESSFHGGDARVKIDSGYLAQILLNLGVNARDAMPTGGRLSVRTGVTVLDEAYAATRDGVRPGRYVVLEVGDTGAGMTPDVRSRAFDPFFTTKGVGKGTGLGLSVVHGFVKSSGGYIDVQSEPGRGSTFTIYLPAVDELATSIHADASVLARGNESVLLVEDDEQVRKVAVRSLRDHGYDVVAASDGIEALELFENHGGNVALLITDVVMPRMGGRQLAEALRERAPGMKVLYMSGYTDDAIVRHGVRQAEVAFIEKPHTRDALLTKVRELLD
jgi:PAS domain S-box-containing protein